MTAINWKIRVSGYGTFEFVGTEVEAEEMRRHKAQWEQGSAVKWRADLSRQSDRFTQEMALLWDKHKGAPAALVRKRNAALVQERKAAMNLGLTDAEIKAIAAAPQPLSRGVVNGD